MTRTALILISVVLFCGSIKAQFIPKRWALVYTDTAKSIYIDTTSIRNRDKQYIFWTLDVMKSPLSVSHIPEPIYRTKTQYVVNDITDKFNIIGILYYDKIGRLVGENYNRGITGAGDVFSKSLDDEPEVKMITQKVELYVEGKLSFNQPDSISTGKSDFIEKIKNNITSKNKSKEFSVTTDRKTEIDKTHVQKDLKIAEKEKKENRETKERVSFIPLPQIEKQKADPVGTKSSRWRTILKLRKQRRDKDTASTKEKTIAVPEREYEYNAQIERPVTKTIFTDGEKYVVQVSSWKNRNIAEREKIKLEKMGYDSFITQVYLKKKRVTWNRVRVGYFDTLKEAKRIEKEIKRLLK